jgi:glycosyltransferase involved in cell wall biosynthesis
MGLRRLYGIPGVIIPNGIQVARFSASQKQPTDKIVFVCVANLTANKNHDMLLKAFAAGLRECSEAQLVIVGDGPLRSTLERQVVVLGIADRVVFLGTRGDVPELLHEADAFVLASAWEGHPLCVMEAMAAGKPVICTRVGGIEELVSDGVDGLLVKAGDTGGFAHAMVRVYVDRVLRSQLAQAASKRARAEFDVSAMARGYAELYQTRVAYSLSEP